MSDNNHPFAKSLPPEAVIALDKTLHKNPVEHPKQGANKKSFFEFVKNYDNGSDEWTDEFLKILSDKNQVHYGDCTNAPCACNLCVIERLLVEYREYFFKKPEEQPKQLTVDEYVNDVMAKYHSHEVTEGTEVSDQLWLECCKEIANRHGLGTHLVTGHRHSYFKEAAELYVKKLSSVPSERTEKWTDTKVQTAIRNVINAAIDQFYAGEYVKQGKITANKWLTEYFKTKPLKP